MCVTSVAACQTRQCPTATMPGTFDPGSLPHHTREQGPCWASGSCMSARAPSARRNRDFVSVVGVAPEARTAACRPHGGRIVRRYHRCSRRDRAKKVESGHRCSCAARRWLPRTRFFKNAISPAKVKGYRARYVALLWTVAGFLRKIRPTRAHSTLNGRKRANSAQVMPILRSCGSEGATKGLWGGT